MLQWHRSHTGNTALHIAARANDRALENVKAMLYMFCDYFLPEGNSYGNEPPEEWPPFHGSDEEDGYISPLIILCEKNDAGLDAAAEVKQQGHQ